MKVITIAGRKGGTGKTTLALTLAAYFARSKKKVTYLDLDPQGTGTEALGIEPSGHDLASAMEGNSPALSAEGLEKIEVIAGGPALEIVNPTRELAECIQLKKTDYLIIDCPPGAPRLERLALEMADKILIVAEAHKFSLTGASRVLGDVPQQTSKCLVLGRYDGRRALDKAAPELLQGALGLPVFHLRQDSGLSIALNASKLPQISARTTDDISPILKFISQK